MRARGTALLSCRPCVTSAREQRAHVISSERSAWRCAKVFGGVKSISTPRRRHTQLYARLRMRERERYAVVSEPWSVEVSRPVVEGVELLSRGRGVEACRGLSRPVEADTMLASVEGCRGVSRVSRVSSSRMSSGCQVCCQVAPEVSRCPRWQDAVAAHQRNLGSSCKAVSSLSCSLSVAPLLM